MDTHGFSTDRSPRNAIAGSPQSHAELLASPVKAEATTEATTEASPVKPGDVLAEKYRVERVLGVGGMGVVVLARHLQLDDLVALKFLLADVARNWELSGHFLREARLSVKLKSEHVAKVRDTGTLENGAPFIVMEYLLGDDLNQLVGRCGALPWADVAEFIIQACDGIAEAHSLGIVHRDLKPANLFLTRRLDGTPLVKVLDFGISKSTQFSAGSLARTPAASVLGSPHYMSPEQVRSAKDVDSRSDVWSLGVITYQLLTARLPFDADTLGGVFAKVLQDAPQDLRSWRPDVPAPMCGQIARCLEKDPRRRCPNVGEIALSFAPYAHPRARPIAERVAALLGATSVGTAREGTLSAERVPTNGPRAWETSLSLQRAGGGARWAIAGVAFAAALGFAGWFVFWRHPARVEGAASSAVTTSSEDVPTSLEPSTPSKEIPTANASTKGTAESAPPAATSTLHDGTRPVSKPRTVIRQNSDGASSEHRLPAGVASGGTFQPPKKSILDDRN